MKQSPPFLLAQVFINLLVTGVAIWIALRILEALPPLGSDWFGAVITGIGLVIALTVAGGAVWMLALSLRDQLRDQEPRQATRPSATRSTAAFASDSPAETSAGVFAGSLDEWRPDVASPVGAGGLAESGAADAACEPGDSDAGGDLGGDLGGMDSGGGGC